MLKSDQHYIDAYKRFVMKFDCAVNQIKHRNMELVYSYDSAVCKNGYWRLNPPTIKKASPLFIILENKQSRTKSWAQDIENLFGFEDDTMYPSFHDGYCYQPDYKNCWTTTKHWSISAGFELGRFMFNKYFDKNLKCELPSLFFSEGIILR